MDHVVAAFLLTLVAGASTGIGSVLAILERKPSARFLSISLGLSAGVLLYLSFVKIFPESVEMLETAVHGEGGRWVAVASFFAGILFVVVLDRLLSKGNPHHAHFAEARPSHQTERSREPSFRNPDDDHGTARIGSNHSGGENLFRMGVFTATVLAIHNLSEGLATLVGALHDLKFGLSIAVAIAIHNIPEGISIAAPIYAATGNRKRAFGVSFLSGVAEPVGALIGIVFLKAFFTPIFFGILLGSVSGIMVYLALDQLLPTARGYGQEHTAMYALIAGMLVMALSLVLLH